MENRVTKKRIKPLFIVDLLMALLAMASAWTGIEIHYAGHFQGHGVWHTWAVVHLFVNVAWFITCFLHCKHHWAWYKSLFKGRQSFSRKSKVTLVLSIIFTITALTGISLLIFAEGQGSRLGHWHYILGLVLAVIGLGHFLKRFSILRKGLGAR